MPASNAVASYFTFLHSKQDPEILEYFLGEGESSDVYLGWGFLWFKSSISFLVHHCWCSADYEYVAFFQLRLTHVLRDNQDFFHRKLCLIASD